MYEFHQNIVSEIWKLEENLKFVSEVASADNHLSFVLAAVDRVPKMKLY